jgi:hypothetical protein
MTEDYGPAKHQFPETGVLPDHNLQSLHGTILML